MKDNSIYVSQKYSSYQLQHHCRGKDQGFHVECGKAYSNHSLAPCLDENSKSEAEMEQVFQVVQT